MTRPTHEPTNQYAPPQQYAPQYAHPSFDPPATSGGGFPSALEIIAAVVIAAGFVISLESISTSWVDGEVTSFSYTNTAALVAGGLALLLGLIDLIASGSARPGRRGLRRVAAVVIIGLGVLHLLRGGGVFAEPPAAPSHAGIQLPRAPLRSAPPTHEATGPAPTDPKSKCEAGDRDACLAYGVEIYEAKQDLPLARSVFERNCDAGDAQSCWNMTVMLDRGEGGPEDDDRARIFAERACELGHEHACKAVDKPSPWLRHSSHPNAIMIGFGRRKVGFERKVVTNEEGEKVAEILVAKRDELRVEVTASGKTVKVGSFPREGAVECFVDHGHLFALVYEYTDEGKITSTNGFRFELGADGPVAAGTLKGPGRLDWRNP